MFNIISDWWTGKSCRDWWISFWKKEIWKGERDLEGAWVLGGGERVTGLVFLRAVAKRDTDTLAPILFRSIKKGSIVYSDLWGAYEHLWCDFIHRQLVFVGMFNFPILQMQGILRIRSFYGKPQYWVCEHDYGCLHQWDRRFMDFIKDALSQF